MRTHHSEGVIPTEDGSKVIRQGLIDSSLRKGRRKAERIRCYPCGRFEETPIIREDLKVAVVVTTWQLRTSCMNFLQTGRMSLLRVALNIMTCFSCGVARKISCTSRRMSGRKIKARVLSCCRF